MDGITVVSKTHDSCPDQQILEVAGYIDTTTSAELEREIKSLIQSRRYKVIVDLTRVSYISSAGWGIFISVIREIRENGGDLKLVGMVPDVYEVFELLEFQNILGAYPNVEEAVNAPASVS
jgi:anti-sigma B factor antagonist